MRLIPLGDQDTAYAYINLRDSGYLAEEMAGYIAFRFESRLETSFSPSSVGISIVINRRSEAIALYEQWGAL